MKLSYYSSWDSTNSLIFFEFSFIGNSGMKSLQYSTSLDNGICYYYFFLSLYSMYKYIISGSKYYLL